VRGETLRQLYYKAEKILILERQIHSVTLSGMRWRGIGGPPPMPVPIARLWNAELQRRLAEPA
jgi:hypothetical protein